MPIQGMAVCMRQAKLVGPDSVTEVQDAVYLFPYSRLPEIVFWNNRVFLLIGEPDLAVRTDPIVYREGKGFTLGFATPEG